MARFARVVLPGCAHHVTQRGVRSMGLFFSDADRQEYLRLLAEQGKEFGLRFLSYCLMTNHVHLVVVPRKADSLARAIGEAHRLYTRRINFRQGARGYLFQGRFFSCPLDEKHGIAAVRYVERNPVRARLAKEAWDYRWSSAAFHAGLAEEDPLVVAGGWLGDAKTWRQYLKRDPEDMDQLRRRTRTGRPLGSERFMLRAERATSRRLRPLPGGRPKLRSKGEN